MLTLGKEPKPSYILHTTNRRMKCLSGDSQEKSGENQSFYIACQQKQ